MSDDLFYNYILGSLTEGLMTVDRDFIITTFNPALEQILEISTSQVLGRPFIEVFPEKELEKAIHKNITTGQSFSFPEYYLPKRGKGLLLSSITISPLINGAGAILGSVILVKDLQVLKEIEESSWQADKLLSLKTLLAGLTHEIRNPLLGIRGAAQLLERELADPELKEYPQVIIKEVDRLNFLIANLTSLTYMRKPFLELVNIHEVLERVILLERQTPIGQKVQFSSEYDPSIPHIMADENLLRQVFINLIQNSLEAMPEGGEVRVRTKISSDYQLARINGLEHHISIIKIQIQDTGGGIPKDKVQYLFTPFFTTKPKGSGLGLAICQEIIWQHKGRLRIESVEGKGSTAIIFLPLRQ